MNSFNESDHSFTPLENQTILKNGNGHFENSQIDQFILNNTD